MAGYDAFAMGSSMAPATAYGPGVGGPSGPPQSFDATIPAAIGIGSSSDEGDDDPAAPVENPFEDPSAWSWSQYISGVGQVFQGYVNAAVGMVTGTAPGAPALRAGIPFCSLAMRLDIHRF
jgi:hypothetical protein